MAYLTPEQLKSRSLLTEIKNCSDDAKLQSLLEYCTSVIDSFVGYSFKQELGNLLFLDGTGEKTIALPKRVTKLISLSIDNLVTDIANIHVIKDNKVLFNAIEIFPEGEYNISIIADTGWETVPEDVLSCLVMLCNGNFNTFDDSEFLEHRMSPFQSEKIGNYSYQLRVNKNEVTGEVIDTTNDSTVDMILDKYRESSQLSIEVI